MTTINRSPEIGSLVTTATNPFDARRGVKPAPADPRRVPVAMDARPVAVR
jgi:hypothetical protein